MSYRIRDGIVKVIHILESAVNVAIPSLADGQSKSTIKWQAQNTVGGTDRRGRQESKVRKQMQLLQRSIV